MVNRTRPRAIKTSPGERLILQLGKQGSDYLLVMNHNDGDSQTQEYESSGEIPEELLSQMGNIYKKGRDITQVSFETLEPSYYYTRDERENEYYFVRGRKTDGSGDYYWSNDSRIGSGPATDASVRLVAFGEDPDLVTVYGTNGFSIKGSTMQNLQSRIQRVKCACGTIFCIRLFAECGGYFIRDSLGTEWYSLPTHLSKELKIGDVLDVTLAVDGSWIVLRETRFVVSKGISSALQSKLAEFYGQQNYFVRMRMKEIADYDNWLVLEKKKRAEENARRIEEERIRRVQEEKERVQKEKEAALRKKRLAEQRNVSISAKKIKIGSNVTIVGMSGRIGDTTVKSIRQDGIVDCLSSAYGSIAVEDVTKILPTATSCEQELSNELILLCQAEDDYEAAIAVYACHCSKTMCVCKKVATLRLTNQVSVSNINDLLLLSPIIGNAEKQSNNAFDEYKCPEKIDLRRLKKIVNDLKSDGTDRRRVMNRLLAQKPKSLELKNLQKCHEMETLINNLLSLLCEFPIDENGCVSYVVTYQYRDSAYRGRLFAIGKEIMTSSDKYLRTTTLQGMYRDLRIPLVGAFAHDIDCENSEVRILCSLAKQLNLGHLVSTLMKYRDERRKYLALIQRLHGVTEDKAKILPTIILSGGTYATWLQAKNVKESFCFPDINLLKKFLFGLQTEILALGAELLKHPRFSWTCIERQKLEENGIEGGNADIKLVGRIVHQCENEILSLIHRSFIQSGWIVRAKIFDGVIVEKGQGRATTLLDSLHEAEKLCLTFGWSIKLMEKPLSGLQDDPIRTIEDARDILAKYQANSW
jgi:hypothetical protein